MSEAIAAVVFDLDGVLVDSESVWDAARREVVARHGGRWQADATRAMMGMSSPEWSRYLHDQLSVPLKPEQINALVIAALLDQFRRRLPLLPGAVVAVRRLADRWPLGLASSANRPVIDTVLKQAAPTASPSPSRVKRWPRASRRRTCISPPRTGWVSTRPTLLPWRTRRTACGRPPRREWS